MKCFYFINFPLSIDNVHELTLNFNMYTGEMWQKHKHYFKADMKIRRFQ